MVEYTKGQQIIIKITAKSEHTHWLMDGLIDLSSMAAFDTVE